MLFVSDKVWLNFVPIKLPNLRAYLFLCKSSIVKENELE